MCFVYFVYSLINYLLTDTVSLAEITQYQTIGAEIILHDELGKT